jgi:hypothetical protein
MATPPRLLAEAIDYETLRDGLRARAAELGISRLEIDRVGRLSEGHSGRLLSRQSSRLFAIKSLGQILKALGARLLLVEDQETTARTRRLMGGKRNEAYVRKDNHWRNAPKHKPPAGPMLTVQHPVSASELGQRGARARNRSMTPAQRSAAASRAASARWARARRVMSDRTMASCLD